MKKPTLASLLILSLNIIYKATHVQTVSIYAARVISILDSNAVYVTGALTGKKAAPITGYTIDLIYGPRNTSVRIVTNALSTDGLFQYIGLVPPYINISAPYRVKVTTNRQISYTALAQKMHLQLMDKRWND